MADPFPSQWLTQRETSFDKFMRGVGSVGVRCTALAVGDNDAVELRMGDWVRMVDPSWWQADDPFGHGQQIGREMIAMQGAPQSLKDGLLALTRPQEQRTFDKLEAALAALEAAVVRLKAATEALRRD